MAIFAAPSFQDGSASCAATGRPPARSVANAVAAAKIAAFIFGMVIFSPASATELSQSRSEGYAFSARESERAHFFLRTIIDTAPSSLGASELEQRTLSWCSMSELDQTEKSRRPELMSAPILISDLRGARSPPLSE